MRRSVLGGVAGWIAWILVWVGIEKTLSALWPDWFGVQQMAFEAAIADGVPFAAETGFLLTQVACCLLVSLLAGYLAALAAGENRRAPLVLGVLLLALGILKMVMSWPYVPLWYHLVFTSILVPAAIAGGRLRSAGRKQVLPQENGPVPIS